MSLIKSFFRPAFCVFPLVLFFSVSSLYAFSLPSSLGRVRQELPGNNKKTLIIIEEAHARYDVQKNIAGILKKAAARQNPLLVLVEGGWGDVGLSHLRSYGTEEGRLAVAEEYLKAGKITGEEYLDIVSSLNLRLWGVEDSGLYMKNMEAFLRVHDRQEEWLAALESFSSAVRAAGEKMFPPALVEFLAKKDAHENGELALHEYLRYIARDSAGAAALEKFPHLSKIAALAGDKSFDQAKAEWEKQELVRALARRITKSDLDELAVDANRKTAEEELAFIRTLLARSKEEGLAARLKAEHLQKYAASLEETVKIDSGKLFSELRALQDDIMEKAAAQAEQKKLLEIVRAVSLLRGLIGLKLGPDEFSELKSGTDVFDFEGWTAFLVSSGAAADWDAALLRTAFREAREFYIAAEDREKAMIRNAAGRIKEEAVDTAVLILGGFHTERISREFQEQGFTVLVVSPRFAAEHGGSHEGQYFEILKEKWGSRTPGTNLRTEEFKGGMTYHAIQR